MPSWTSTSMWSRETTAASLAAAAWTPSPSGKSGLVSEEPAVCGSPIVSIGELEKLLAASIKGQGVAVTVSGRSANDAAPIVCAVSRGAEELYDWTRSELLGESGRILDAGDEDLDATAKLMSAQLFGAEASVVRQQRKASGELFKAFQLHRGLSLGFDPSSGEEVWYLLTVSFDITAEYERESRGTGSVDYDFYLEAASSIAAAVKASIADMLSAACPSHRQGADTQFDSQSTCEAWDSEEEEEEAAKEEEEEVHDESMESVRLTSPMWVECPPEAKFLLEGFKLRE